MRFFYKLALRLRSLFRKRRVEQELTDELRFHLEESIQQNIAIGMTAEQARYAALRDIGGVEQIKEQCRDLRRVNCIESFFQDLRYGMRQLRRSPGFTLVAVITLALGIGANTAIFSMIDGLLLRPLPVAKPSALAVLGFARPGNNNFNPSFSYAEFREASGEAAEVFSEVSAFRFGGAEGGQARPDGLTLDGVTKPIEMVFVTGNFFSMLGVKPSLGRLLLPSEGAFAGKDPVIVLSYGYWASRFSRDASVVGKSAFVNGHPVTIVGVAPEGFVGVTPLIEMQGYMPLGMATVEEGISAGFLDDPKDRALVVLVREKAHAGPEQMQAILRVVGQRLLKRYPRNREEALLRAYPLRPPGILSGGNPFPALIALFLTLAGLVLAIACVNVANLVLARTLVREREMAVRAAIGASRGRLLRQWLTESVLLAALGCACGSFAGIFASKAVASLAPPTQLPMVLNFQFDWRVFTFAWAAAMVAVALIGIAPALRASRVDLRTALQSAGRSPAGGRQRVRQALIAVQVAGSVALLIVAGLFLRSLRNAEHVDLGFAPDHLLNLTLDPGEVGYTKNQGKSFYSDILERVRALPGVRSASLALDIPLGDAVIADGVKVPGHLPPSGEGPPSVLYNAVSPHYFETLGIGLLRGRDLSRADDEASSRVAVVSEAMAKKFWPNQDAVGKRFTMQSDPAHPLEVVGVVRNSRITGVSGPFEPCFYLPLSQHYVSGATLQIRTAADPALMARPVVDLVDSIAPAMPVLRIATMQQALGGFNGLFPFELGAGLSGALGLLGLLLAVVGIFGVTSYVASQRTPEIGIRMVLGAQPREIWWEVLSKGLKAAVAGLVVGNLVAGMTSGLLADLLIGVRPRDPLTFAGVSLLLAGVVLLASYIPARRATKVDPMVALRYE